MKCKTRDFYDEEAVLKYYGQKELFPEVLKRYRYRDHIIHRRMEFMVQNGYLLGGRKGTLPACGIHYT